VACVDNLVAVVDTPALDNLALVDVVGKDCVGRVMDDRTVSMVCVVGMGYNDHMDDMVVVLEQQVLL